MQAIYCGRVRQPGSEIVLLRVPTLCGHTRRMRLPLSVLFLGSALLGSAHADGDSLVDMLGPREVAVGEAMRGDATGASAIGLNPAGLPLNHELVFEGGYGYRASDQASLLGVSACDSTNALPGCFFYNYAGASPAGDLGVAMPGSTTTHIGGIALAKAVAPHVLVGSTVKYFHYDTDLPGQADASGFTFDLGLTLQLTEMASLGFAGYNLWGEHAPEMPRAAGGGIALKPLPMLTLSYDMRWILDPSMDTTTGTVVKSGARFGGGAELFLRNASGQTGFPIRAGALRDNGLGETYLSAGLGFSTMSMGLDVGARKSIAGVAETMVLASVRLFGPRVASPTGE
jgi:hypothetical protein